MNFSEIIKNLFRWFVSALLLFFIIIFAILLFTSLVKAEEYTPKDFDRIVEAIGKAENSVKFPYGVKSLKYENRNDKSLTREQWARKICYNSVRNNFYRWLKAGKPEDFIVFLSRRYCPINAPDDPKGLNKNWYRNVLYFLKKG